MKDDTLIKITGIESFGHLLAKENHRLIRETGESHGEDVINTMLASFVSNFVDSVVTEALNKYRLKKDMSNETRYKKTERNLNVAKNLVQNSVADGFSKAMGRFGKQELDYYCTIKLTPSPINKHMC